MVSSVLVVRRIVRRHVITLGTPPRGEHEHSAPRPTREIEAWVTGVGQDLSPDWRYALLQTGTRTAGDSHRSGVQWRPTRAAIFLSASSCAGCGWRPVRPRRRWRSVPD